MTHTIVPATKELLLKIEAWLDDEEAAYQIARGQWAIEGWEGVEPVRGFRCNWDSTNRRWGEGYTQVDVLLVGGQPVGFLDGTDILEIRPSDRGKGYGRLLADFMLQNAIVDGRSVLEIEIAPASAQPFWEKMGFTVVPQRSGPGGGTYAYRVLDRSAALGMGKRVSYLVEYFDEAQRYADGGHAFLAFEGEGEVQSDGSIKLPERAYCFHPDRDVSEDCFVRIVVGGEQIHFEKVKRDSSRQHGCLRDKGYFYYMDRVVP